MYAEAPPKLQLLLVLGLPCTAASSQHSVRGTFFQYYLSECLCPTALPSPASRIWLHSYDIVPAASTASCPGQSQDRLPAMYKQPTLVLTVWHCLHRDCKARFVFVLNVIFSKAPRLGLVMAWATNLDPFHPDKPWEQLTPHERCLQE